MKRILDRCSRSGTRTSRVTRVGKGIDLLDCQFHTIFNFVDRNKNIAIGEITHAVVPNFTVPFFSTC